MSVALTLKIMVPESHRIELTLPGDFPSGPAEVIVHSAGARAPHTELLRSLSSPHPESRENAELGMEEWARGLPEEDAEALVDPAAGRDVRWRPEEGWSEIGK